MTERQTMSELLHRRKSFDPIEVRAEGADTRRIRFVISTGDVDRENDTIDPAGWDLTAYRRNPVVLWAHDRQGLPIAKAIDVRVEGDRLIAVAEFATHPMATTVFELYRDGFLRATSVGFRATKWARNETRQGIDFLEHELLEFSCVPVPANAHALVTASAAGVDLEPVRQWVQRTLEAWPDEIRLTGKAWRHLAGDEHGADVITIDSDEEIEIDDDPVETWAARVAARAASGVRAAMRHRETGSALFGYEQGRAHHRQPDEFDDADPAEVARAIAEVAGDELRGMIGREVRRSILRIRGRVLDPDD